ncbi:MAG: response regulator transcription factor [Flavobacteriales bacterium]|nr:response regulator transcription factor [Flavobacteriales bacterium]
MVSICLVEDEKSLRDMIQLNLELENYAVTTFEDGKEALSAFEKNIDFDLIILDVMLPYVSGLDLCRFIREKSPVPILFLSAKGTTADRVNGLKLGANDYLPKPFDLEELLLKVHILTQKSFVSKEVLSFEIGNYSIDLASFEVKDKAGNLVHVFSKREVELLKLFKEKENKVISRDEILDKIWGKDQFPTSRTIDNYILVFRKIFEIDPKNPIHFHSIRGVGYKFNL